MLSPRLSLLALVAALTGCSSLTVNTQYDPTAPYATYKTYAWNPRGPGPDEAPPIRNPIIQQQVVSIVDRELAKKGFTLVKPEANPDVMITLHGWAQSRVEVTNYGYAYGGTYMYAPYPYRAPVYGAPAVDVQSYTDGTLLIDFVDGKTMKLVWRGTASDSLSSPDPGTVSRVVDEATRQLMAAYPPKVK
jgi:hypothetical protein